MPNAVKKLIALSCVVGLAVLINMNCVSSPEIQKEPEPDIDSEIRPEPKMALKPYQRSMLEEMQKSYENADEIIMGVYTGNFMNESQSRAFYFDNFRRFNKEILTWSPAEDVLLPILFQELQPEIITREEFKTLSDLDKVGICWDYYEQARYVYLVEGEQTIAFLKQRVDEINNSSYRYLIDTYPVTKYCKARAIFDLMVRDFAVIK